MSICQHCKQEMLEATDCTANRHVQYPDGEVLQALPFEGPYEDACHDCGVAVGKYHHPGCDMERCPRCHGELISCGCGEGGTKIITVEGWARTPVEITVTRDEDAGTFTATADGKNLTHRLMADALNKHARFQWIISNLEREDGRMVASGFDHRIMRYRNGKWQ